MTAILPLPVVYEAVSGRSGRRLTVDDFRFAVVDRQPPSVDLIRVAHDGGIFRYGRTDDGSLWCPIGGPDGEDVPPAEAPTAVKAAWSAMFGRHATASVHIRNALLPLRVGRRVDGTYYPRAGEAKPWPARRRTLEGDRDARFADVSRHVGDNFMIVGNAVWRRCVAPMVALVPGMDGGEAALLAVFCPEGMPEMGAGGVWDMERFAGMDSLRKIGNGASWTLPVLGEAPSLPAGIRTRIASRHDNDHLNVMAVEALVRTRMHEYLPWMSSDSVATWMILREAFERISVLLQTHGNIEKSDVDAFFAAVAAMAGRFDVGHDAQTGAARWRWNRLARIMKFAAARHFDDAGR